MPNLFERLSELTIKVSGFDPRVDGTPEKSIGWPEIAHALGQLRTEQSDVLRAIYLHDASAGRKVYNRLIAVALDTTTMSRDMATALSVATLRAYGNARACPECDGVGLRRMPATVSMDGDTGEWQTRPAHNVVCWMCKGDGLEHISHASVQLMMRVSNEVWEMMLADAFAACYTQVRTWHDSGKRAMGG